MQADDLDLRPPRAARLGFAFAIVLLHLAALYGLMRAFAPDFTAATIDRALSVFDVAVPPPPEPSPPQPEKQPDPAPDEGVAGDAGHKAAPRVVAAPKTRLPVAKTPAPPRAGTGNDNSAGAAEAGIGPGAGGAGSGPGSGRGGAGGGGMPVRKLEKIAGDINSARDYPKATRAQRVGHSVTILLSVDAEGRVTDCQVSQPSPDPAADTITCRLASERFRFRPALDAQGNAVPGKYAWRQRWFY